MVASLQALPDGEHVSPGSWGSRPPASCASSGTIGTGVWPVGVGGGHHRGPTPASESSASITGREEHSCTENERWFCYMDRQRDSA